MDTKLIKQEPNQITEGCNLIFFKRKDTKKNPVAEADKFRGIEVPQFDFGTEVAGLPEVFRTAIVESVQGAAGEMLRIALAEKPTQEVFDTENFTLPKIIEKMAELQASQRLNGEQIGNWFDASLTKDFCIENYKGDAAKLAKVKEKYSALASNNPAIKPTEVTKLLSFIQEGDLQHPVCKGIVKRLERLQNEQIKDDEL